MVSFHNYEKPISVSLATTTSFQWQKVFCENGACKGGFLS